MTTIHLDASKPFAADIQKPLELGSLFNRLTGGSLNVASTPAERNIFEFFQEVETLNSDKDPISEASFARLDSLLEIIKSSSPSNLYAVLNQCLILSDGAEKRANTPSLIQYIEKKMEGLKPSSYSMQLPASSSSTPVWKKVACAAGAIVFIGALIAAATQLPSLFPMNENCKEIGSPDSAMIDLQKRIAVLEKSEIVNSADPLVELGKRVSTLENQQIATHNLVVYLSDMEEIRSEYDKKTIERGIKLKQSITRNS